MRRPFDVVLVFMFLGMSIFNVLSISPEEDREIKNKIRNIIAPRMVKRLEEGKLYNIATDPEDLHACWCRDSGCTASAEGSLDILFPENKTDSVLKWCVTDGVCYRSGIPHNNIRFSFGCLDKVVIRQNIYIHCRNISQGLLWHCCSGNLCAPPLLFEGDYSYPTRKIEKARGWARVANILIILIPIIAMCAGLIHGYVSCIRYSKKYRLFESGTGLRAPGDVSECSLLFRGTKETLRLVEKSERYKKDLQGRRIRKIRRAKIRKEKLCKRINRVLTLTYTSRHRHIDTPESCSLDFAMDGILREKRARALRTPPFRRALHFVRTGGNLFPAPFSRKYIKKYDRPRRPSVDSQGRKIVYFWDEVYKRCDKFLTIRTPPLSKDNSLNKRHEPKDVVYHLKETIRVVPNPAKRKQEVSHPLAVINNSAAVPIESKVTWADKKDGSHPFEHPLGVTSHVAAVPSPSVTEVRSAEQKHEDEVSQPLEDSLSVTNNVATVSATLVSEVSSSERKYEEKDSLPSVDSLNVTNDRTAFLVSSENYEKDIQDHPLSDSHPTECKPSVSTDESKYTIVTLPEEEYEKYEPEKQQTTDDNAPSSS